MLHTKLREKLKKGLVTSLALTSSKRMAFKKYKCTCGCIKLTSKKVPYIGQFENH